MSESRKLRAALGIGVNGRVDKETPPAQNRVKGASGANPKRNQGQEIECSRSPGQE